MELEQLRKQAAAAQGWVDEIVDLAFWEGRDESWQAHRRFLAERSDDLNSQVAHIDSRLTGFGTSMLDPAAERARRGKN